MSWLIKFLIAALLYSSIISKSIEDEVLPRGVLEEIYNASGSKYFPDYSIIHQIDIFRNESAFNDNGHIIIIDESGIPKTKGIDINISNQSSFSINNSRLKRQYP